MKVTLLGVCTQKVVTIQFIRRTCWRKPVGASAWGLEYLCGVTTLESALCTRCEWGTQGCIYGIPSTSSKGMMTSWEGGTL